ncbi:MAG: signal peptide peptidase SppA [Rhodospirillaceae bacterium]
MFKFLYRAFALFGLLTLAGLAGGGYLLYHIYFAPPSLAEAVVLSIDLDQKLVEQVADDPLTGKLLGSSGLSLRDVVDAFDRGARDRRVKGAVIRIGGDEMGMAQVQEIRGAIARFRAAGKFTTAFAETFGEFGPGNKSYYLASACEQVWLQPLGMVGLTGLAAEMPFARKLLDQLHLVPEVGHREEYKSAMESLTERTISGPHREMLESLLDDLTNQLVGGVSAARKLEPSVVRRLIDSGPLLDHEARDAGLVDRLGYYDELNDEALEKAGTGGAEASMVTPDDYLAAAGELNDSGPTVALIFALGGIERGDNGVNPMMGGNTVGSDALVLAIQQAVDDEDVRAILLRIDSPGGSVTASETIRRAVVQAKAAGKPVIVSMSDMAASGGYWIAMNADKIIAEPATLTGSIGVIVGKLATSGFWDSFGITWEGVKRGANAGIWSNVSSYTPAEKARVEAVLDDVYSTFTRNVADARHLTPERVREIARGRVWTGHQAVALGLVDELGDLDLALQRTREAIGLKADSPVSLDVFPRPKSQLERVLDLLTVSGARFAEISRALAPVARAVAPLSGKSTESMRMPEIGVR